ncbi:MAG: prepilin peptidase [Sporichthyaceae bacterium]
MTSDVVLLPLLAVLGLSVGSFLNVVVHRVPLGISVNRPRSACPGCGHAVRVRDNIPVLSWLLLRARCRDCEAPISVRYPVVELATAAAFVAVGVRFAGDAHLPAFLYLAAVGLALALIDLEHQRLPFLLTVPAIAITVGLLTLAAVIDGAEPVPVAALSALMWLALFGGLWFFTGGRGMGFGDVVLAPTLGLALGWLGWGPSLVGLLAAFATGSVVGVTLVATNRVARRHAIPFGPFMIVGAAIGVFAGAEIWSGYLAMSGLG